METGAKKLGYDESYGNFDTFVDHLSRISQLRSTCHAPCTLPYRVPMQNGC